MKESIIRHRAQLLLIYVTTMTILLVQYKMSAVKTSPIEDFDHYGASANLPNEAPLGIEPPHQSNHFYRAAASVFLLLWVISFLFRKHAYSARERLGTHPEERTRCSLNEPFEPDDQEHEIDMNDFKPATILVADDVQMNRELISEYFANSPHQIIEAINGHEAVLQILKHRPDIVLMDLAMPVMNGFQAARRVRNNTSIQHTPLIMMTVASPWREPIVSHHYYDGMLRKPIRRADLYHELRSILLPKTGSSGEEPVLPSSTVEFH